MVVHNKKVCPECGQVVNKREVTLYSGMVKALLRVYAWCHENGINEFTRKDMKHLFRGSDNLIARWGDWVLFGNGMVYKPNGKGTWGLNMGRVKEFIDKQRKVPTTVVIDRTKGPNEYLDYKSIDEIPNLSEFLDQFQMYIVNYRD